MAEAAARAAQMCFIMDDRNTLRADPPEVWVKSGDTLTLIYEGDAPPTLFVPNKNVFGDIIFMLSRSERDWRIELPVLKDAPMIKLPFALYAPDRNQIAEGYSPPRMNINDPDDPRKDDP